LAGEPEFEDVVSPIRREVSSFRGASFKFWLGRVLRWSLTVLFLVYGCLAVLMPLAIVVPLFLWRLALVALRWWVP
jgi:hypothetical protein